VADALVRLREKFVSKSIFHTLFNEIIFIIQVKNIKKSSTIQPGFFVKQLYFLLENNGYGILFKKKCGLAY